MRITEWNKRSFSTSIQDHQLATALFALLMVYMVVTVGVFLTVSSPLVIAPPAAAVAEVNHPTSNPVDGAMTSAKNIAQIAADFRKSQQDNGGGLTNSNGHPNNKADHMVADVVSVGPNVEAIRQLQQTFPVHVGDEDLEEINHPGLEYTDPDKRPQDVPETLKVPKFWHPDAAYGNIRDYLGQHGNQLMTVEQAKSVGSFKDGQETVYISIASYRDPECASTLESIYLRAKHPERIRVAVIEQIIEGDDRCLKATEESCSKQNNNGGGEDGGNVVSHNNTNDMCHYRHLVDIFRMDARAAIGPVFARHVGHRMYRGEYFAMQVDSHVEFVQDWDEDLLGQWKSAHNEMAVLTTYLSDIVGSINPATNKSQHPDRPIMCASDYEGGGTYRHLRHGQQPEGYPGIQGQPTLHPFWAAGFSFARGHFVVQVPYDQRQPMVFQGEEINIGLRGFSYGYDYYASERSVCFHMYAIGANKKRREKVKMFWENSGRYPGASVRGMKRLNGIIQMPNSEDPTYDHTEEFKYGLGKVRNVDKFFHTFGIHRETKTVEQHLCTFVGKPMHNVFIKALRPNGMGLDYDKIDYVFVDPEKPKKKKVVP